MLPNAYLKNKSVSFPVLYLLHGYSGNYASWVNRSPNLLENVDKREMIVVCPDGGYGSWYFDSPIDPRYQYETHIVKEVVPCIDSLYRTVNKRSSRAIAGLSMGGHGAMFLAIKHKNLFGACVSLSGGVDFTPFENKWDIAKRLGNYQENKILWTTHTVQYLVRLLNNNDLTIFIDCGTKDFFIGVNRILHQTLTELNIEHTYTERPGEHNWDYWNNAIVYQLFNIQQFFLKHK